MSRVVCLFLSLVFAGADARAADSELLLATTTSVRDSGLMDLLLPAFEAASGIHVRLVAVGSGAALRMGEKGDADVLLTHAPETEAALVERGLLLERRAFMENHFVLAGPPDDPAGVRGKKVADALRAIASGDHAFVSRADDSGTHRRERALLREAGLEAEAHWSGVIRTGAGMGQSLQVAWTKQAYILSDVATYRAFREQTGLVSFSGREPALRNVYSVLPVNPSAFPAGRIRGEAARRFADFLVESETRKRIAGFGDGLFVPIEAAP